MKLCIERDVSLLIQMVLDDVILGNRVHSISAETDLSNPVQHFVYNRSN
jgi:hypothetical protein